MEKLNGISIVYAYIDYAPQCTYLHVFTGIENIANFSEKKGSQGNNNVRTAPNAKVRYLTILLDDDYKTHTRITTQRE